MATSVPRYFRSFGNRQIPGAPARRLFAPLAAIAATVLSVAGGIAGGVTPAPDASVPAIVSYYSAHSGAQKLSATLSMLGALAFLVFAAYFVDAIRVRTASRPWAALCFGGAILLAGGLSVLAGISVVLGGSIERLSGSASQAISVFGVVDVFVVTVGTSAFMLGAGAATLVAGFLPRWLGWTALSLGVIAAVPSHVLGGALDHIGFAPFVGLLVWIVAAGILVGHRASVEPGDVSVTG